MEPIDLHYSLTLADFMKACRAHWRAYRQSDELNVIAGVAGLGIGAYVHGFAETWGLIFLMLSAMLLVLTVMRSLLCAQGYRQSRKYTESVHVTFGEFTIHVDSAEGVSDLNWSFYCRYHETPDFVLLYMTKRAFSIIPKKAFTSEAELARFLELVAHKLKPVRGSKRK